MRSVGLQVLFATVVIGCQGLDGVDDENDAEGGNAATTGSADTTTDASAEGTTTTNGSADETTDSGDDSPAGECILWDLDECGDGQKCMPWSLNDDRIPDDIRCCPAMDNPDVEGDPCTISDYDGSCLDSCAPGMLCVLDDVDTLGGQCRRFCQPGGSDCTNDQTCKTFFELLPAVPNVPLCMDQCDPLLQDCALPTWLCIPDSPTQAGQSGFICVSPPPQPPHVALEPCALANDCSAGLVCLTADRIPDCGGNACCTAFCDLADGDASCQALHPDLVCVDWMAPDPKWEHVGACAIPD